METTKTALASSAHQRKASAPQPARTCMRSAAMAAAAVHAQPFALSGPHHLAAPPDAAVCARRPRPAQLCCWRLHSLAGTAELLSELVASALADTRGPATACDADRYDSHLNIILRMIAGAASLIIGNRDRRPELPALRDATVGDGTGRGRHVIDALSRRCGQYLHADGKVARWECGLSHRAPAGPCTASERLRTQVPAVTLAALAAR